MAFTKMVSITFVLCSSTFCVTAATSNSIPSFASFITKHRRSYKVGTDEYKRRLDIFKRSLAQVHQQNSKRNRLWTAAINHLSDRTEEEFAQLRGLKVMHTAKRRGVVSRHGSSGGAFLAQIKSAVIPEEKSWAHLASVQKEADQGACGSCWAVATSVMLEANAEIVGINRTFSMQELVDCVPNPHNCGGQGGCKGATVELGMNWVMSQSLDTDAGTPYKAEDETCKKTGTMLLSGGVDSSKHSHLDDMIAVGFHPAQKASPVASLQLEGWERLPENEYEPLIRAVAERGPAAVSVGASDWASYSSGIFDSCSEDSTVDHAVTLIGYGIDKATGHKFWHIKNSWGNSWGESGTIRLLRKEGNVHCGTDYKPKEGTACDGSPPTVHVCGMCGILFDTVVPHFSKHPLTN